MEEIMLVVAAIIRGEQWGLSRHVADLSVST